MSARPLFCVLSVALLLAAPAAVAQQGLDGAYREAESLSTDEKVARASKDIERMKESLKVALQRLKLARDKKDIIQVNCVNDKLSAIKGLLKISEQADVSLKEAGVKRDLELINHEFTKISIAAVRVENFRVEVEGCVGELSQYTGKTQRELSIDEDIPEADPSEDPIVSDFVALDVELPANVTGLE